MTRKFGGESVVIVRAPLVTDSRDNTQYRDWNNATRTTVTGCGVEPFPLAEKLNFEENRGREFARSAVRVYMPPGVDIVSTDRLEWDGDEYTVLGHPGKWSRLNGKEHHIAVIAQRREG